MKIKLTSLLIILLLLHSCKWNPRKDIDDFLNDVRIEREYFSNGNVKTEVTVQNNMRNGLTRNFDRDGHLLSEVNYVNDVREGMAKNYYPGSGKMSSSFNYIHGKKEGDEIWYYESGKPYRVSPYIHDSIEGIQKKYYENGKLLSEVPFDHDMPGRGLKEYYQDGRLFSDYPTIVFKKEDHLASANMLLIIISLSNKSSDVKFYRGRLESDKYLTKKLMPIATKDGIAKISYTIPPGAMLKQTITVCARYTTINGNPYIMQKAYTILAISPN